MPFLLVAACGSDDGGDSGGDSAGIDGGGAPDSGSANDIDAAGSCGTASVSGTVGGETLSGLSQPFTLAFEDGSRVLVMSEGDDSCAGPDETGPDQRLAILFCDAELRAATYTVVSEQDFPDAACPGDNIAGAVLEAIDGGGDIEDSAGGTLTLDSVDGCVTGSFSITFTDDNTMTGTFGAEVCQ